MVKKEHHEKSFEERVIHNLVNKAAEALSATNFVVYSKE